MRLDKPNFCILRAMMKKFGVAAIMEALTEITQMEKLAPLRK